MQTLLNFPTFCKDIDDTQHGKLDAKKNKFYSSIPLNLRDSIIFMITKYLFYLKLFIEKEYAYKRQVKIKKTSYQFIILNFV